MDDIERAECFEFKLKELWFSWHLIKLCVYFWGSQFQRDCRYQDLFWMLLNNRISFEGITTDDDRINDTLDLLFDMGAII